MSQLLVKGLWESDPSTERWNQECRPPELQSRCLPPALELRYERKLQRDRQWRWEMKTTPTKKCRQRVHRPLPTVQLQVGRRWPCPSLITSPPTPTSQWWPDHQHSHRRKSVKTSQLNYLLQNTFQYSLQCHYSNKRYNLWKTEWLTFLCQVSNYYG